MSKPGSKIRVALIAGARPNFMKVAPLLSAMKPQGKFIPRLIHTGQHFDTNMSQVFFDQLDIPVPDVHLNLKGRSSTSQIAKIMLALEGDFTQKKQNLVIVFGDVNSTLAAALVANKIGIPLAHVEAGLRSFDRAMPEEHNRVVTDMLSDLLFTPSPDADANLINEGIPAERIYRVGNIMVDSLMLFREKAAVLDCWREYELRRGEYALVTLHRPSNIDDSATLHTIFSALERISKQLPIIFPVHPRTRSVIKKLGIGNWAKARNIKLIPPLRYLQFLNLMMNAKVVLTDSGGIQEETTVLGVPCLTLRKNTERPITVTQGTNRLVGTTSKGIFQGFQEALDGKDYQPPRLDLWDGKTAQRIIGVLRELF